MVLLVQGKSIGALWAVAHAVPRPWRQKRIFSSSSRIPHNVLKERSYSGFRPKTSLSNSLFVCSSTAEVTGAATTDPSVPISLTERALAHLKKLKAEHKDGLLLFRVGVRSGGCSGLSYIMEFESEENVSSEDAVFEYDDGDFRMICDPKSLLYLFGMQLDYSDALIGGGFQFHNPNATDTCGCGKSFGV